MVNSASGSNDKPRDIVKKCYTGLTEEESATSKSRSALSQKVRRIRRRKLGDEVVANEVSEIVIPVNQRYMIVLQKLREEQANTEAYIVQINTGTTFPKKQTTIDYDMKILNLVENYNKLEIDKFLYNISLLMSQKSKKKNPLV